MNLRYRYPIAIDLSDDREFVAVQLCGNSSIPVLRAALQQEPGTASAEENIGAFFSDVLHNSSFKGRNLAVLPSLEAVFCCPLRFTLDSNEDLESAVVREAAHVLDFPVEEAVLDYVSVSPVPGGGKGERQVLLVAMRKSDVKRYIDLAREAGGVLEIIDSAGAALLRAHLHASGEQHKTVLLCNAGRSQTSLAIVTPDSMLAQRNVKWGTDRLEQKLIENLNLGADAPEVDFLLREHGISYAVASNSGDGVETGTDGIARPVAQIIEPVVDQLVYELHSMVGYVRSTTPGIDLGGVHLYGRAATINGLAPYISRELGMPSQAINPLEKIGLQDSRSIAAINNGSTYAQALGLGMRRSRWL